MKQSYSNNKQFEIMGLDQMNHLVIKIKRTQVFITLRPEGMGWRKLTTLGSTSFWSDILDLGTRQRPNSKKPLHPNRFLDEICENMFDLGSKKGLFKPQDVRGYGAWREKGNLVFNLGDRLLLNGVVEQELDDDRLAFSYLGGKALEWDTSVASDEEMVDWVRALKGVNFENKHSWRCLVGWLVISILGGVLDWRPHLWLVGPSSAGKSWLLENVCKTLLGEYLCITNNVSEAGISRKVGNASLPICIDEAEVGMIEPIFVAMRNASTGFGSRIRASQTGGTGTDEFLLRSCFLASSITVPEISQRDSNRIIFVRLAKDPHPEKWPEKELTISRALSPEKARRIRNRIITDMAKISLNVKKIERHLMAQRLPGRIAKQYSAIFAGFGFVVGQPDGTMSETWLDDIQSEVLFSQSEQDFELHMETLLQTRVDFGKGVKKSVVQALLPGFSSRYKADEMWIGPTPEPEDMEHLQWLGIKLENNNLLRIAYSHKELRDMLSKTALRGVNLREMFKQGGDRVQFKGRKRFGSQILSCVDVDLLKLEMFKDENF